MLDEGFRRRISDLAEVDESGLDEAARERIFEMLRTNGPALVRSGSRRRLLATASGIALAAAAAAALFVGRHRAGDATPSAGIGARTGEAALACAARAVAPSSAAGFVAGTNGARLDLGAVAVATSAPGTVVRLEEASPCRTLIALESGTVAVHAKDLGGGELRVRTNRGDVVVHGTIFAVTKDDASLEVEVVVGNVVVTDRDDSHSVQTGQRLLLSAVGAAQGSLAKERAHELRAALGVAEVIGLDALPSTKPANVGAGTAPPVVPPPVVAPPTAALKASSSFARAEEAEKGTPPVPEVKLETDDATPPVAVPAQDPLALAEQARRAGDYAQARELYRRAAEGSGITSEAALVALARMELSLGHTAQALQATKRRQERFGRGTLGPEALWIDVRSYRQMGDVAKARELANSLVEHWPSSPQARAAQQWLSAH
jgi:ferric-dicitrate binding protein FerR (iron transport regulator)